MKWSSFLGLSSQKYIVILIEDRPRLHDPTMSREILPRYVRERINYEVAKTSLLSHQLNECL